MSPLRRLFAPVRRRATIAATVVVLLALALGSVLLLAAYRGQLEDALDNTLSQQVADRVALLDEGSSPQSLTSTLQDESFVWIGTPSGEVQATGGSLEVLENPVPVNVGGVGDATLRFNENHHGSTESEVETVRIASGATVEQSLVVVAGAETETIGQSVSRLANLFVIAVPILSGLVGALVWLLAGRILEPVEAIRFQASAISGTTLDERVPVPETKDEIHDLAVTMNEMLGRLQGHDRSMRQFSSDASHELKSPVANIRTLVDTAAVNDPSWTPVRQQLVGETNRLSGLVDNLLYLSTHNEEASTSDAGTFTEDVQLDELLFAEAELVAATGRVAIDLHNVNPVQVRGSSRDLQRLVRNLVDNAARHAENKVRFSTLETSTSIDLAIDDDGPGVAASDRDRIFDRFTRLDEARARDTGGSGLGLAIVSQIASDHHATVSVDDSTLGGASFRVTFRR